MSSVDSGDPSTTPKPFVFVLMPINAETENVYRFGIKGAAADVGAYAERVDEQNFTEGILDRIFNQINKADVIVADMTGKNPNVFYEVGYAHALGKLVVLITQQVDDIPFDLKHRQHVIYAANNIETLKTNLGLKLIWAIQQSKSRAHGLGSETLSLLVVDQPVPEWSEGVEPPKIFCSGWRLGTVPVVIQNTTPPPHSIYGEVSLFTTPDAKYVPAALGQEMPLEPYPVRSMKNPLGLSHFFPLDKFRISLASYGAVNALDIPFILREGLEDAEVLMMLRIQTAERSHDFIFNFDFHLRDDQRAAKVPPAAAP